MNSMKKLQKNVINTWQDQGEKWLKQLPITIEKLAKHWSLQHLQPVTNMSYNYVALAMQQHTPVVLKISCDPQLILDEYQALKHFNGQGAINIIDFDKKHNALLLTQALPGETLAVERSKNITECITIYCEVIQKLAQSSLPTISYSHVEKWCRAIDRITDSRIEKNISPKPNHCEIFY